MLLSSILDNPARTDEVAVAYQGSAEGSDELV
jgi:hypothetical protein